MGFWRRHMGLAAASKSGQRHIGIQKPRTAVYRQTGQASAYQLWRCHISFGGVDGSCLKICQVSARRWIMCIMLMDFCHFSFTKNIARHYNGRCGRLVFLHVFQNIGTRVISQKAG
jgi:hypothetical protein